jgi:type I restriction enzyme R subunit
VVRELKLTGLRTPNYNRRADLVCFVNGLPLVFIELKAVYKNIRAGFDGNLRDYMDENVIAHAFHHNAFLIVSNGHNARYGSITSTWEHFGEWKRLHEDDRGQRGCRGVAQRHAGQRPPARHSGKLHPLRCQQGGRTRKVVARNHQMLGVNQAVASVRAARGAEARIPYRQAPDPSHHRAAVCESEKAANEPQQRATRSSPPNRAAQCCKSSSVPTRPGPPGRGVAHAGQRQVVLDGVLRREGAAHGAGQLHLPADDRPRRPGHPDLQAPSWAAAWPTSRRPARQLGRRACSAAVRKPPLRVQPDPQVQPGRRPDAPYSERDDIIVVSDEAHRTQAGKLARNMRMALPNAAFIGFTGTPLFKHDQLTKRIFGDYVSRYDFKRSEEDGATVKLVYENRGEKLGLAKLDLNDRIADAIDAADLDPDQEALAGKAAGQGLRGHHRR